MRATFRASLYTVARVVVWAAMHIWRESAADGGCHNALCFQRLKTNSNAEQGQRMCLQLLTLTARLVKTYSPPLSARQPVAVHLEGTLLRDGRRSGGASSVEETNSRLVNVLPSPPDNSSAREQQCSIALAIWESLGFFFKNHVKLV